MGDVGIATRLRRAGLTVREVEGWKTRGRDFAGVAPAFNPKGSVNHHTATPASASGTAPSLRIVTQGRSDLPGPLCNVYQARDDTIFVVAAGVANHAGAPDGGACRGMTGNSQAYGLEIEHPGTSLLPAARVKVAARVHAALLWRPAGKNIPASQVVQHREWAPSRKIDLDTNFRTRANQDGFRTLVRQELARLDKVTAWTVSYLNADRARVEATARDLAAWTKNHPGAFQRGRVFFDPKRS